MVFSYDDQDRLVSGAYSSYTYTANGDVLTKTNVLGTTTYTHDALGNLTEVILPNNDEISYIYDGRNRLISKQVNGIVEYRLIYGGQLAPVAKVDASGNTIENYIYGLGVNSPDYILKDGTKYRVIKDHLGSTRMIVDSSTGEVVKTLRYSEFGETTEETGTFDTIFGFAGGIRDNDTDLTKFGARWYDSTTGRWMEKEPLGFRGAMNFYTYAHNDPVNFVDRNGLWFSWTHEEMTKEVMEKLGFSPEEIKVVSAANSAVDNDQIPNYLHFMPEPSGDMEKSIDFIFENLAKAIELRKSGKCPEALEALGQGLHTLQDYYSHWVTDTGWIKHITNQDSPDSVNRHPKEYGDAKDASDDYIKSYLEGVNE